MKVGVTNTHIAIVIQPIILILPFNYNFLLNTYLGSANMVDVGSKDTTRRMARAVAVVDIGEIAYKLVANNQVIVKKFALPQNYI